MENIKIEDLKIVEDKFFENLIFCTDRDIIKWKNNFYSYNIHLYGECISGINETIEIEFTTHYEMIIKTSQGYIKLEERVTDDEDNLFNILEKSIVNQQLKLTNKVLKSINNNLKEQMDV